PRLRPITPGVMSKIMYLPNPVRALNRGVRRDYGWVSEYQFLDAVPMVKQSRTRRWFGSPPWAICRPPSLARPRRGWLTLHADTGDRAGLGSVAAAAPAQSSVCRVGPACRWRATEGIAGRRPFRRNAQSLTSPRG